MHTQKLPPQTEGNYKFFIICLDKAGNVAKDLIEFTVERDTKVPEIISIYKDEQLGVLIIRTDEPAQCEYAEGEFPFGRGTAMASGDNLEHSAALGGSKYFIKCRDFSDQHNEVSRRIVP